LDDEDLLEELLEELLEVLPEELLDELLEESELISPDSRSLDFRISSLFCFVVLQDEVLSLSSFWTEEIGDRCIVAC
jgi:hypothetical protein